MFRSMPLMLLFVAALFFFAFAHEGRTESCIECHLHGSFVGEAGTAGAEVKTLAGFHATVIKGERPEAVCLKCHGAVRQAGKRPSTDVCTKCHTRGNVAQGDPRTVFHAEKEHWFREKVSCVECHKGHVSGNPDIKFLTTDTIGVCRRCHEKSFNMGKPL